MPEKITAPEGADYQKSFVNSDGLIRVGVA